MSKQITLQSLRVEVPQQNKNICILDIPECAINAGEIIGISGPSGSGKTTLLHCMAGLIRPTSGRIEWNDRNIAAFSQKESDQWRRNHIGLVFQDFQLIPELSVIENISLPLFFSHWRLTAKDETRLRDYVAKLGLRNPDQSVASLSRGEQQRVSVARALWQKPSLILADEPTASLDRVNADQIITMMLEHTRQNNTILIVASHDPAVLALMDRIIELDNGCMKNRISSK
jgi:ABC-type lipoprotein export system ATPase subunit